MILTCGQCDKRFDANKRRPYCSRRCANIRTNRIRSERIDAKPLTTVWMCGGGVDSTAIACLISIGKLPTPNYSVMVDSGYELQSAWKYVNEVMRPRLSVVGVKLSVVKTIDYTEPDIVDKTGHVTIPAYRRNENGKPVRLRTHCSNNWKAQIARRWLREQGVGRAETWIGIAADESRRCHKSSIRWIPIRYPLVDHGITREMCLHLLGQHGWPMPKRTSCYFCPGHSNRDWVNIHRDEPESFSKAVEIDRMLRRLPHPTFLHGSCVPLEEWIEDCGGLR